MLKPSIAPKTRLAVGLTAAVALLVSACSSSGSPAPKTVTRTAQGAGSTAPGGSASAPSSTAPAATPVHMRLKFSDGSVFGVGIPVIATFNRKLTSGAAIQKATKVTVNGKPAQGAWYFEYSDPSAGYLMEGHYRLKDYWPAHSAIHVDIPVKGLSAGTGLVFDDSLSLDFRTGPRNISVVNDATHKMTVTSDGKTWGTFPVSLGARNTPTSYGTKVIMEKGRSICMSGPGYHECGVKYTQRLTYGGEYLHSAPWNVAHIESGYDSSNGCTNLLPSDAAKLYDFLRIGDVVDYPNANGPRMTLGSGYGDWNLSWSEWLTGGAAPTQA